MWVLKVRICMANKQFTKADNTVIILFLSMESLANILNWGAENIFSAILKWGPIYTEMLLYNNILNSLSDCSVGSLLVTASPFWSILYSKGKVPSCQCLNASLVPSPHYSLSHSSKAKPLRALNIPSTSHPRAFIMCCFSYLK